MNPLLSICIPTYNRLAYLRELIGMLLPQIDALSEGAVELIVSNNVSPDGTAEYCESIDRCYLRFWTNETNIGGDRNFLKCIKESRGEYVWLVGDDDIVPEGAVANVLQVIRTSHPDLIISGSDGVTSYEGYAAFLGARCQRDARMAMAHTLISANVFRREVFDMDFAVEKLYTQYAHMFGLMKRLDGRIIVIDGIVETRPVRAEFAKFPSFLCVKQSIYLWYLAERFNCPRLKRYAVRNACSLPLEFGSRIKNWLLRLWRRITCRMP